MQSGDKKVCIESHMVCIHILQIFHMQYQYDFYIDDPSIY